MMARFTNGWVKVYRSTGEGDLIGNPILFALWFRLLIMATWKPTKILSGGKQRELPPGSVVFGLREFAESWDCSKGVIHKWLRYLHDTGRIVHTASTRGTIVTICKWETYQSRESDDLIERERGEDTASTPREHGVNLIEEGKKGRKKEARTGVRLEYSQEFEQAWELYLRRGEKKAAWEAYTKLGLTLEERSQLLSAIAAYVRKNPEAKYRLHFHRFLLSDWREHSNSPLAAQKPAPTIEDVLNGRF